MLTSATLHRIDKRLVSAIVLGNTIAWADFALYAYFSPVLSKIFFPFTTASTAYLLYFIVFALGFLFRPLGSAIAGAFADRHGRKNTLLATVAISSITTMLIGCLPSYNSVGFISPFLLAILRILQTMSVSAEPTNSSALLLESSPKNIRGLVASCVMLGVFLGFLLGIFSFLIVSDTLSVTSIYKWGWRIPFILFMAIGLFVVWFLSYAKESPVFLQEKAAGNILQHPLKHTFKTQTTALFLSFGYGIMMAVGNYFLIGFVPDFLQNTLHVSMQHANLFITISLAISVILIPVMGYLSDIYGRKPVMAFGAVSFIIFSYPILYLISTGNEWLILIALCVYGVILAPIAAPLTIAASELFPSNVRCSGSGIGYNAALTLCGGTTPLIAQYLIMVTKHSYSPFWYISTIAVIHLLFVILSREPKNIYKDTVRGNTSA